MSTVADEKNPYIVLVFPVADTVLWGVSLLRGHSTLYHSKKNMAEALAEARSLAGEHGVAVSCSLETFFDLTVEAEGAGFETFTAPDGYVLTWERAAYSADRLGLDHLSVEKEGQSLGEFSMYHDTDSDVVDAILQIIAPGMEAFAVVGQLS